LVIHLNRQFRKKMNSRWKWERWVGWYGSGRGRGKKLEDNNDWKVLTSQSPAPEETVSHE
jgi:hypothetical protein